MPQNVNVNKIGDALRQGIRTANHLRNVGLSRDAADRETTFFGGGDMSGKSDSVSPDVANRLTAEAARLPVRDAEDSARMTAAQMMAKPSSYKYGGTVRKSGFAMVHRGEKIVR